jgi:WS/DGAT/MGAT family acyltransferase
MRALTAIPRLRQRVVADPVGVTTPRWEADPDFDSEHHIRELDLSDDDDLFTKAAELAAEGFDRDHPLWELYLVHGLPEGKAGVIMKIHHAVADGVGMLKMTEGLIETEREPDPSKAAASLPPERDLDATHEPRPFGGIGEALSHRVQTDVEMAGRLGRAAVGQFFHAARHPVSSTREFVEAATSVGRMVEPARAPLSPLFQARSADTGFDALSIPLRDLKAASRATGATLNDLFVAAVLGGMGRYHDHHGHDVAELRMNMPINVRSQGEQTDAGNQFVPARFHVPIDIEDPAERVAALHNILAATRAEPALPLLDEISASINRMGIIAATRILGGMLKAVDLTTSNVPGPWFPVYTAGARIEHMYPFGPLAGSAVNITLLSFDGACEIGINADRSSVDDLDVLTGHITEGFAEVVALGWGRSS